jgi:hypothetical protein
LGHVRGEVWAVDDRTLASLDRLEGHPRFYRRERLGCRDPSRAGGNRTDTLSWPGRMETTRRRFRRSVERTPGLRCSLSARDASTASVPVLLLTATGHPGENPTRTAMRHEPPNVFFNRLRHAGSRMGLSLGDTREAVPISRRTTTSFATPCCGSIPGEQLTDNERRPRCNSHSRRDTRRAHRGGCR